MTVPLGLPIYHESPTEAGETFRSEGLGSLGPYVRRSTGLSLFNRGSYLAVGTNPHRRSNHRLVVRPCDPPNPDAGLLPLAGMLRFGWSSLAYPHVQLFAERLLSTSTVTLTLAAALAC